MLLPLDEETCVDVATTATVANADEEAVIVLMALARLLGVVAIGLATALAVVMLKLGLGVNAVVAGPKVMRLSSFGVVFVGSSCPHQ